MNNILNHLSIAVIVVISIASMFAILSYLTPLQQQQQSAYTSSLKTSDLKHDVKQQVSQDNLCHRSDGCNQANDGLQLTGKDNTASGFNDQSATNTISLSSTPISSIGAPGPQGLNGSKGELGPAGVKGDPGAAGPPSLAGKVYTRDGPLVESSTFLESNAQCEPGDTSIEWWY